VDYDQRDQSLGLASCYPTFMFGCLILQDFGLGMSFILPKHSIENELGRIPQNVEGRQV